MLIGQNVLVYYRKYFINLGGQIEKLFYSRRSVSEKYMRAGGRQKAGFFNQHNNPPQQQG